MEGRPIAKTCTVCARPESSVAVPKSFLASYSQIVFRPWLLVVVERFTGNSPPAFMPKMLGSDAEVVAYVARTKGCHRLRERGRRRSRSKRNHSQV